MNANPAMPLTPGMDVTEHPLVHDVNQEQADSLSATEKLCKRIADSTGAPVALGLAVLIQAIWIVVGIATKWDPFPFAFLLTVSNVLQLILIFILAVGQRQSSSHAELRAEHDHDSISRLLYHQELQERILIEIAGKIECDVGDIKAMVAQLAAQDSTP
jgi:uncharacterized membrane protein